MATVFDSIAADYDQSFSTSAVGRRMRAAVWRHLDAAFVPGQRVIELNCGTGDDAIHLARRGVGVLATDASAAMLDMARAKVGHAGLGAMVELEQHSIEQLTRRAAARPAEFGRFDGALSNFGGLNCVADLPGTALGLAAMLRPGARALLCVMGPAVPWEWGWYLAHGEPRKAARRLRRGGTLWRGMPIRYPSIGSARRAFAPYFAVRRVAAVGALLPPPYAGAWAERHPRLLGLLDRCERCAESIFPLPWLADHYLMVMERR